MDRDTKLGGLFLCLFALPFAGFGLFALATAIHQMLSGTADTKVWILLIFGLVFTGFGLGLMSAVILGGRIVRQQQRLQAEHPAEPWLWRKDWAQGRIQGGAKSGMIGAWIFAVLWNLISAPILFVVPQQAPRNPIAYVGLMFPLVGLFLLIRAVRLTRVFLAFGSACFEMAPVPAVIGGELRGTVQVRFPRLPDQCVRLQLNCLHRITSGSGDSQNTSEHIVWRGESSILAAQLYPGPNGISIPVNFRVPWDALATYTSKAQDAVVWQLRVSAEIPGVDYNDVFEVPVFRTSQTPSHPPEADAAASPLSRPSRTTVEVKPSIQGVEFYFPAARNTGFALGVTTFLLIFGAVTCLLAVSSAPRLFAVVFGFFSLLLLYITAQMWMGTTRIGIGESELLVQDGFLGGGKVRRFPFAEIASITSAIRSQQGGGAGTPYYDIEMNLRNGKKVTLGRTLRNQQEAAWLVDEMRRLAGLQQKSKTASTKA